MAEERKNQGGRTVRTLVIELNGDDLQRLHIKAVADRRSVNDYAAIVLEHEARRLPRRKRAQAVA